MKNLIIIGLTQSGKNVYATCTPNNKVYNDFTLIDHSDAEKLHEAAASKFKFNTKECQLHLTRHTQHYNMFKAMQNGVTKFKEGDLLRHKM